MHASFKGSKICTLKIVFASRSRLVCDEIRLGLMSLTYLLMDVGCIPTLVIRWCNWMTAEEGQHMNSSTIVSEEVDGCAVGVSQFLLRCKSRGKAR